jgi:hypothetical protein
VEQGKADVYEPVYDPVAAMIERVEKAKAESGARGAEVPDRCDIIRAKYRAKLDEINGQ